VVFPSLTRNRYRNREEKRVKRRIKKTRYFPPFSQTPYPNVSVTNLVEPPSSTQLIMPNSSSTPPHLVILKIARDPVWVSHSWKWSHTLPRGARPLLGARSASSSLVPFPSLWALDSCVEIFSIPRDAGGVGLPHVLANGFGLAGRCKATLGHARWALGLRSGLFFFFFFFWYLCFQVFQL